MNDALDDLMARVRKTNEKLKELGVSVDGAVPDYNEDGTANPIGDASYWRSRAEAAEATLAQVIELGQKIRDEAVRREPFENNETHDLPEQWDVLINSLKGGEG